MSQAALQNKGGFGSRVAKFTKSYAIILAILLLVVAYTIGSLLMFGEQYFFTWNNLRNILNQTVTLAVVCCGQALIVTTGDHHSDSGGRFGGCVQRHVDFLLRHTMLYRYAWFPDDL